MLFNSYVFIFAFLPVTFIGFFLIARRSQSYAALWLGLASIFFYGYWSRKALPLLLLSVLANYWFGKQLTPSVGGGDGNKRKKILIIAVTLNLAVLGYFKYANFFIGSVDAVLQYYGLPAFPLLKVILPLGISFFTFTQIGFLVDCYQNKVKERNFSHYLLFVTFFPHLLAGPLIHHRQMMPQFADEATYRINLSKIALGIGIFVNGLSKKVLLADPLGTYADLLYDKVGHEILAPQAVLSWMGSLAYTFQVYFDFSGYSDMAVGLGLLFGILLPINFNSPYKATSIISFWQRWHMTLTSYAWEYLYTPLTLKFVRLSLRKGKFLETLYSLVIPTTITFLLIGLWHGAHWTYVVFGALQAVLLIGNHLWRRWRKPRNKGKIPSPLWTCFYWFITFLSIHCSIVMFRAESVASALTIYKGMAGLNGFGDGWQTALTGHQSSLLFFVLLALSFFITLALPSTAQMIPDSPARITAPISLTTRRWMAAGFGLLFALSVLCLSNKSPFLYFQF